MARALLLGCGCSGRLAGARLLDRGWAVRGSSRDPSRREEMEATGIEPVDVDPDLVGTVVQQLGDVTVLAWTLGEAGPPEAARALHRERLPSLLEKLVDTPVRGLVYEAAGSVAAEDLEAGADAVTDAAERWHIPVARVEVGRSDPERWADRVADAVEGLLA